MARTPSICYVQRDKNTINNMLCRTWQEHHQYVQHSPVHPQYIHYIMQHAVGRSVSRQKPWFTFVNGRASNVIKTESRVDIVDVLQNFEGFKIFIECYSLANKKMSHTLTDLVIRDLIDWTHLVIQRPHRLDTSSNIETSPTGRI